MCMQTCEAGLKVCVQTFVEKLRQEKLTNLGKEKIN